MIVFGTTELLMSLPPGSFNNIYNLCSPYDVGIRLHHLIPLTLNIEDPNFDFIYADYILNNNDAFMEMMNLVLNVYYGTDAYVLADEDNSYKYESFESLLKFLQQRYGLIIPYVRTKEDLESAEEIPLNIYGVMNLDIDKERYYESLPEEVIQDLDAQCRRMEGIW